MAVEQVFLERGNTIELLPIADGELIDMSGVERITVEIGDTVIDSEDKPQVVYLAQVQKEYKGRLQTLWVLFLKLGHEDLAVGSYTARITFFDTDHLDGLVWGMVQIEVNA